MTKLTLAFLVMSMFGTIYSGGLKPYQDDTKKSEIVLAVLGFVPEDLSAVEGHLLNAPNGKSSYQFRWTMPALRHFSSGLCYQQEISFAGRLDDLAEARANRHSFLYFSHSEGDCAGSRTWVLVEEGLDESAELFLWVMELWNKAQSDFNDGRLCATNNIKDDDHCKIIIQKFDQLLWDNIVSIFYTNDQPNNDYSSDVSKRLLTLRFCSKEAHSYDCADLAYSIKNGSVVIDDIKIDSMVF